MFFGRLFIDFRIGFSRESNGVWVPSPHDPEIAYRLRDSRYRPYREAVRRARVELADRYDLEIPRSAILDVMGRLAIQFLLLEWKVANTHYSASEAAASLPVFRHHPLIGDVADAALQVGCNEADFLGPVRRRKSEEDDGADPMILWL